MENTPVVGYGQSAVNAAPSALMPSGTFGVSAAGGADELRYQVSFGNISNKTVYLDTFRGIKPWTNPVFTGTHEAKAEVKAALSTSSPLFATGTTYSATSGSIPVLLPTWVDQQLYDTTRRDTPYASGVIPRVTNNGLFADYIIRSAVPTSVWKQEGGALASVTSTYTRAAKQIKFAYAVGEVSGPMLVASKIWQDALRYETEGQYRSLKYLEEDTIINGDTTNATYTYAFDGLAKSITTNVLNKAGAELVLSEIDTALQVIREARGHPNVIVTDWRTFYRVKQLMRDFIRFPDPKETLNWGFEAILYENIPIIPNLFMTQTATQRELHVLDTQTQNNIQMRVLQDATFEELAKTADSYKFMIKLYETMVIINEAWCYRIYNLA